MKTIVIINKELARLIVRNGKNANAVYINMDCNDEFIMILPIMCEEKDYNDIIVIKDVPENVINKIKVLIEIGTNIFTAFEPIKSYLKKDK